MRKIKDHQLILFFNQLSTLISAGVPLIRSFEILETAENDHVFSTIIHRIQTNVLSGKSLFVAFSHCDHLFNALICQLIAIGENTGKLDEVLTRIAKHLEQIYEFKKQMAKILFYPLLTFLVAMLILLGLLFFVIPKFSDLYVENAVALPLFTRILFAFANGLNDHLKILSIITCVGMITFYLNSQQSMPWRKWFFLLPGVKHLHWQITILNFIRNLQMTYQAGLPITKAIELSSPTQKTLKASFAKIGEGVSKGKPLHIAMTETNYFPLFIIQMVQIGEESGKLDYMLLKIVYYLEQEIHYNLNRLAQSLEPLIMILLGVVIGGLVIGMYLPIFKLGSAF